VAAEAEAAEAAEAAAVQLPTAAAAVRPRTAVAVPAAVAPAVVAVMVVVAAVLRRRPAAAPAVVAVMVVVVEVLRRRPVVAPAAVVPVVGAPEAAVVPVAAAPVVADRHRAAVDLRLHPVRVEALADRNGTVPDRRPRSCVAVWAHPGQGPMSVSAAASAVQVASSEGHSAGQAHRRPTSAALSVARAGRAQTSGADCD